jgi:hypothetical protein
MLKNYNISASAIYQARNISLLNYAFPDLYFAAARIGKL